MAWKFWLKLWCLYPAVSLWILRSCNIQYNIIELYSNDYALVWEEHVVGTQDNILCGSSLTRVCCGRSSLSGSEGTFSWLSLYCPACALIKTVSILIKIMLSKAKIKALIRHMKMLVHKSLYMPMSFTITHPNNVWSNIPLKAQQKSMVFLLGFFVHWKHASFLTYLTSNKF